MKVHRAWHILVQCVALIVLVLLFLMLWHACRYHNALARYDRIRVGMTDEELYQITQPAKFSTLQWGEECRQVWFDPHFGLTEVRLKHGRVTEKKCYRGPMPEDWPNWAFPLLLVGLGCYYTFRLIHAYRQSRLSAN
jgi:hypothetical protein